MTDEQPAGIPLDEVARAIKDIADGRPVVVVDDADRENEGDIVFAASKATPELLAFTIRYGRGLICAPMRGADLDRLSVPQMTSAEPGAPRHRVHRSAWTRAQGDHHRHLRGRPGHAPSSCWPDPERPRGDLVTPGPHLPAALHRGRRAAPPRPHRGRGRPGRCWPGCRRSAWCARSIGDDGTMLRLPGAARVRRRARPRADLHRAAHRVPPPHRAAGHPGRRDGDPERLRRLAGLRLPLRHRRRRAPGPRPR